MTWSCWRSIWPMASAAPVSPGSWGASLRWTYGAKSCNRILCSEECKLRQNQSFGHGEPVTDREVIEALAETVGLTFQDIMSVIFLPECQEKFALPNTATVTEEEFGTVELLPTGLTSPGPDCDSSASSGPLSATQSPHENVQEVPGTQAPSLVLGRLLKWMEHRQAITPVPSSLAVPQAPLAPAPCPFRDSFSVDQPVERSAKATALDLI